jgi:hypothetical protein
VRALPYQFRICSSRRRKWGERGLVLGACTQTHTQLHLFIKEYCTVLHGYCNSRLEIEICRCTILYATERDCLAMTQCKRIAGIFGANGGRNASATLPLFSPLIFSFLPLPSSATQGRCRLPGSARSKPPPGFVP